MVNNHCKYITHYFPFLPGVSALPALSGVSAFSGQSIHSVAHAGLQGLFSSRLRPWTRTWGYPHGSRNGVGSGRPPRLPGHAGLQGLFSSRYLSPVRGPAFSLWSQATPGIHRHPYGVRGIFRVGANASHQAGTAPPLWWD